MTREQIIEILKNPHWFLNGKLFESDFERIADAILAIPLDVPSDEEIAEKIQAFRKNKLSGYGNVSIGRLQLGELEWMNLVLEVTSWMREEIIKRNK